MYVMVCSLHMKINYSEKYEWTSSLLLSEVSILALSCSSGAVKIKKNGEKKSYVCGPLKFEFSNEV